VSFARAEKCRLFSKKIFCKGGGCTLFSFAGVLALDEDDYIRTIYTRNCYIKRFFFLYLFLSLSLSVFSILPSETATLLFSFARLQRRGPNEKKNLVVQLASDGV